MFMMRTEAESIAAAHHQQYKTVLLQIISPTVVIPIAVHSLNIVAIQTAETAAAVVSIAQPTAILSFSSVPYQTTKLRVARGEVFISAGIMLMKEMEVGATEGGYIANQGAVLQ
jgi:hypothetical protein